MVDENSRKRLGKGLAALMGELDQPLAVTKDDDQNPSSNVSAEKTVPIDHIRANPNNPRRYFSESDLDELSNSIKQHGIVQPILVRPIHQSEDLAGARYEIVAGERRWRSAQRARLHEVPIIIRELEDKQALEIAIIENVQRADLNAVEEALGYKHLIEDYDYSQNDLAQVIGKSRSHVANTLRLLKLPESVQTMISEGQLSAGHARTLITAENPEALAQKIVLEGLSVRQAEMLNQDGSDAVSTPKKTGKSKKSADILALEQRLEDKLGLKFDLRHGEKEKGELRIRYRSLDQLDEICRKLESDF